MINIGFIGAGNMGSIIMKTIANSPAAIGIKLFAFDPDTIKVDSLSQYGVSTCTSETDLTEKCEYIFIAVKPQIIENVIEAAAPAVTANKVIISIVAGISDEFITSKTIPNAKVILVMPNTPMLISEGASALSRNDKVTNEEFDVIIGIFRSCGKVAIVPKNKMNEIIAINGSSPAFIFFYAKAFIDYAITVGIDINIATELFSQSLIGSAKMITDSGYSIDDLIKMVSSPGGTTFAGLKRLYEGNLDDTVKKCCESCTKRAYELSNYLTR